MTTKIKSKVAAFTITEMLVVLVLSSILVMLAMSVLNLVQKQLKLIETNYVTNDNIRNLERLLWQDFNQYQMYYNLEEDIIFGVKPTDSIHYLFTNSLVIRNNDTLPIEIKQKTLFLEAEKVQTGRVDALELELSKEYQNIVLFTYQVKDATFYVNDKNQIPISKYQYPNDNIQMTSTK